MEAFTYQNIFETKGIEYIIILLFLTAVVPFYLFVSKATGVRKQIRHALNVLTASMLRIPQGLFFNKNHTWAHLEKNGEAKMGLDDFLARVVGNVKVNHLRKTGDVISKGDVVAEIFQDDRKLKIHAPVSGEITAVNTAVSENSGLLADDPYNLGWFYAVKPTAWKNETAGFYLAGEAAEWVKTELGRFKDFLSISLAKHSGQPAMVALQEGGEIKAEPLAGLQPEIWDDFQKEFLD